MADGSDARDLVNLHAPAPATPMEMVSKLIESGGDVEVMSKMLDLQERWQASEARKSFNAAMSAMKRDLPPIVRSGQGHNNFQYATLEDISNALDVACSEHGLDYRFRTDSSTKGEVTVTCIVTHKDGHQEETSLTAAPDGSGSKSGPQPIGSTVKYLRRYTLEAAFGLASSAADYDSPQAHRQRQERNAPTSENPAPQGFDPSGWLGKIATARMGGREDLGKLQGEIRSAIANGQIPPAFQDQLRSAFNQARDSLKNQDAQDAEVIHESA